MAILFHLPRLWVAKCVLGRSWVTGHAWIADAVERRREGGGPGRGGVIELREPELPGLDRLPYPVALTTAASGRRGNAPGGDPLKAFFALKDCFEATIKYLGIVLLMDYFSSRVCTPEHSEALLERMVRPSLGDWVSTVVRDLSEWLIGTGGNLGRQVAGFFVRVPQGRQPSRSRPIFGSGAASLSNTVMMPWGMGLHAGMLFIGMTWNDGCHS